MIFRLLYARSDFACILINTHSPSNAQRRGLVKWAERQQCQKHEICHWLPGGLYNGDAQISSAVVGDLHETKVDYCEREKSVNGDEGWRRWWADNIYSFDASCKTKMPSACALCGLWGGVCHMECGEVWEDKQADFSLWLTVRRY